MRRCVWSRNLKNEEAVARLGPQRPKKNKKYIFWANFVFDNCVAVARRFIWKRKQYLYNINSYPQEINNISKYLECSTALTSSHRGAVLVSAKDAQGNSLWSCLRRGRKLRWHWECRWWVNDIHVLGLSSSIKCLTGHGQQSAVTNVEVALALTCSAQLTLLLHGRVFSSEQNGV